MLTNLSDQPEKAGSQRQDPDLREFLAANNDPLAGRSIHFAKDPYVCVPDFGTTKPRN